MKPLAVGLIVAAVCLHLAAYKVSLDGEYILVWQAWDKMPVLTVRLFGLAIPAVLIGVGVQLWVRRQPPKKLPE